MGVSFICFAAIADIDNFPIFICCALLARTCQGLASASIQVTCYSIAANFYPDRKGTMIGVLEASMGLGIMFGPIIGTSLYAAGGY